MRKGDWVKVVSQPHKSLKMVNNSIHQVKEIFKMWDGHYVRIVGFEEDSFYQSRFEKVDKLIEDV